MTTSILNDVKHALGILPEDETFDEDVMMHINSTFGTLTQLGVGPTIGYMVTSKDNVWAEFATDARLNAAKSYIIICLKLMFDIENLPGPVISAMERQKQEMEFRLNVVADYG